MNKKITTYSVFLAIIVLIDRLTKFYAYHKLTHQWIMEPYVYFQLAMNRGISWGMLSFKNQLPFYAITVLLVCVTGYLVWYAYKRAQSKCMILGELLVIVGALSNIIDRVIYGGVIDFIVLTWRAWAWPVFNIADMAIVLGVIIMFFEHSVDCQPDTGSYV